MVSLNWVDLVRHGDSADMPVDRVRVGYDFHGANWRLDFEVFAEMDKLLVPSLHGLRPGENLWEHSCFELFIATSSHHYREFNVAPDGAWAAYDFAGYRSGRRPVGGDVFSSVKAHAEHNRYRMKCVLSHGAIPDSARHVGLSVILEDKQGGHSFWALEHGPGKPDFHHVKSFRIPLD
jgi:hypothetical protein